MTERPLALVTGASSGIGVELARELAADGHDLILTARREARLRALAYELTGRHGMSAAVVPADLANADGPARLLREVEALGRPVEVLINNAGLGLGDAFAHQDPARLRMLLQVNVVAATELARACLPDMLARRRGGILNVASMAGLQPGPYMAAYYASKAYLLSLSEALWAECRGTGVRVTALCPGPVATEFFQAAGVAGSKFARTKPQVMPASEVARAGYAGFKSGRRMVAPGLPNKLLALVAPALPRNVVFAVLRRYQGPHAG